MGFDLSGVNPKINKSISEYKHYDPEDEIWNSDDEDKRFMSNYPFSQDNVENFAKFCLESGGFEIC